MSNVKAQAPPVPHHEISITESDGSESSENSNSAHTAISCQTSNSIGSGSTIPNNLTLTPNVKLTDATAGGTIINLPPPQPPPRGKQKKRGRGKGRVDWEVLEGLKEGQTFDFIPKKFEGFILKKRKWPLKGYHKRYFMLEKGVIVYGKTNWDIGRGKIHGSLDAGLSVISTQPRDGRIDIDADDCIYHLKIKPKEVFMEWLEQLKQHRLYRQHILSYKELATPNTEDVPDLASPLSPVLSASLQQFGRTDANMGKTSAIEKEICLVEKDLLNLQGILDTMTPPKKDEDNKFRDFVVLAKDVVVSLRGVVRSVSNNVNAKEVEGGAATLRLALNQVLQQNSELKSRLSRIHREASIEPSYGHGAMTLCVAPHTSDTIKSYGSNSEYYDAVDNNAEDRTDSDDESFSSEDETGDGEADSIHSSELSEHPPKFVDKVPQSLDKILRTSPPPSQIVLSNGTQSHSSSPSSGTSDYVPETSALNQGRRTVLPCPAPSGSEAPSLWGILRKNIGKDLSRISMPVTLNEPLGVLQRMCEQLEYSELLDAASKETDPVERLALLAAFAVSGYGSSFWRTHKPFNPLLGETFECIREDKNFRFIAEQVCHHPPISACQAEGLEWQFWEETQPKTKFWGKSMEIQALGSVHVVFQKFNEHFSFNKATTCVHNLFSPASRWVDLYGEVTIQGGLYTATLNFIKASYWSARKHEVVGTIANSDGTIVRNLFGHWNESFFVGQPPSARCIWRMGAMPENHSKFYGFTRFAIELNEVTASLKDKLPITDTRFRRDQRLLEEGHIDLAEQMKLTIEQRQRDRRKKLEQQNKTHKPLWFKKPENFNTKTEDLEHWEYKGNYWETRKAGFKDVAIDPLW